MDTLRARNERMSAKCLRFALYVRPMKLIAASIAALALAVFGGAVVIAQALDRLDRADRSRRGEGSLYRTVL